MTTTQATADIPGHVVTPVIEVKNISKIYRIWKEPAARLKGPLLHAIANRGFVPKKVRTTLANRAKNYYKEFPALEDISFSIARGESVGIVGINGAGKSTLLQILTKVLQPTIGSSHVRGKVAALLELGSGFNPLFTGRENVFLNASILGLSNAEIELKMQEILDFADIGDFIDQPVQTYSSGMRLRLAFSVQIVVDPDVLIVDEALAVGDVFFQAKCMLRLRQLQEKGTTILFVSHSMSSITELCTRALLLDKGKLIMDAKPGVVVQRYLSISAARNSSNEESENVKMVGEVVTADEHDTGTTSELSAPRGENGKLRVSELAVSSKEGSEGFEKLADVERMGNQRVIVKNAQMINQRDELASSFEFGERALYRLWLYANDDVENLSIAYHIKSQNGSDLVYSNLGLSDTPLATFLGGNFYLVEWQLDLDLMHGRYYIGAHLSIPEPPYSMHANWEYVDMINLAYMFSVGARKEGMLGGPVAWRKDADIKQCII